MFMMIFPQLSWLIALDTLGLSWTTGTWPKPTSPNDKDE